jgi:hypothetical protein
MPASTCGTLTERLMAWGLGRIQRGCLRVIEEYEAAGKRPTTFNIAAEVYRVRRDQCGNRMVSDAQRFSTERALASLGRRGLVTGQQHLELARSILDGRSERCCLWSIIHKERPQRLAESRLREG